jgi:hypothetical protein
MAMMEESFSLGTLIVVVLAGLVVLVGLFALIYFLLGGKDKNE